MTKEEFRTEWEKDDCRITFDDIAECAKIWGISERPRSCDINLIRYKVLKAAGCSDAEEYNTGNW